MANAEQLKTLGRYNIERVLGKGAMGVVYEGVDPRLGRRVAIKTILKSALDEDTGKDFAMRFVREAQAVARLNHPNVVQVFDFGEEGDVAYIVMEFIRGKELKSFFDANERFELKEAVRIMCELCDALDFAHEAGIIHRDIKPANVMIDSQGRTKLTDFGVARVQDNDKTSVEKTQAGTMVGTPAYMSPEQITGGTIDRRTDVFSAGIILYQFLTGEKPFTGSGAWTIAKKIIQEDPPLPSSLNNAITPVFDAVVNKALAKSVDERFQTARELGAALKRALEGKGVEDDSDKTVVGGGIIDLDATMKGPAPAMPHPAAAAKSSTQTTSAGTQQGSQEVELEFWRAIKDGNDPDDFELYVQQFPTGIYSALAKRKIAKLKGTSAPEDSKVTAEQEKKEAAEAARKEAEARQKLAEEKEKLELELAQREEEYKRREAEREAQRAAEEQARLEAIEKAKAEAAAERERARQEAEAERARVREEAEKARQEAAAAAEKAKQEAAAQLAAEREKARLEAEKAKQEAAAERERARIEAEKAKKEAEEKAKAEAEQARKEAAAERERAKAEAAKARKEAEEKAQKEAEALAKKQAEERAKEQAEFKKREAQLKAQAAAGGKKASPMVAIIVGVVVLAISGLGYYFFAPDDKAAQEQLKAMQAELKKAQDAQEQARLALDKAKEAEEKAKREGDVAKMKELAEQRARAEAEAKKTADAAKAREADAEKGKEAAKLAKEKQEKDKVASDAKAKEDKAKADKLAADKAAADRAAADAVAREKAAADKAIADARAAAEKAKAEAEKATAEARAAADKARADAEKAKAEAEKARQQVASAAPAASGGAADMFSQAQSLEGQGKGAEAVRVYIRAARGGSGPAAKRLGEIYDKGIDGVSRDYAESLKWRNAARVLGEDVPTAKSRN